MVSHAKRHPLFVMPAVIPIYFKQQIELLLIDVLKDKRFKKSYDKLTNQTQFQIKLFLAYYLTLLMRNSVC